MDRIKSRIVLLLALASLSSIFVVTPARAEESCPPLPDAVCDAEWFYYNCIFYPIRYSQPPAPECGSGLN